MTKQQLEYFLSASEFCNLSKAAAFHYVSIPTFTRHINDLESELSTRLFTRTNRGLVITEAGALFHNYAMRILANMDKYNEVINERNLIIGEPTDRFVIGYYPFGGMYTHFAALIDRYLETWLKKPCVLRCMAAGTMMDMVKRGVLDAGAVSTSQVEKYEDIFESRTFFTSHCILLVDEKHELAERTNITVKELAASYGDYANYLPVDSALPQLQGRKIRSRKDIIEIRKHYLDLLPYLVSSNEDGSTGTRQMVIGTSEFKSPELKGMKEIAIEEGSIKMNVSLFWRRDNNSETIRRFREALDFAEIK